MKTARLAAVAVVAALVLATVPRCADAASVYQPRLAFRVLATPHFRIYYHQGGEALARRLARIAESVRAELETRSRLPAPSLTHVVLANQDDDANGTATPLPYPTIRISAAWPATSDVIGNTRDWLRTVFIHEYAHVVQLERTRGWAKVARALLGRSPISFPNLFLPMWQVEGYATFWESRLTGLGRLNGADAASIVAGRARNGVLPLDQANGGVVEWPGGNTPYLEGAWFYEYLARRFGETAVSKVNDVTAGRLPYLAAPAFRQVFSESLGDLWRGFQGQLVAAQSAAPSVASASRVRKLTDRGYWVSSPRFDEGGKALVYFLRDPHGFPALRVIDLAARTGESAGLPAARVLTDRFGGGFLAVRQGLVFFDEVELRDNVAWRSDLWAADLATGRKQRLSTDARLLEPDVSPDGRLLACVRVAEDGTRALAFFAIHRGEGDRLSLAPAALPVRSEPGATYGAPRWSPDGRQLAAERRREDGPSEIVIIDMVDGAARVVTAAPGGRVTTPAWMPDGSELLFASDDLVAGASGPREFQIYAANLPGGSVRQVTGVVGGASFPDVSPDGSTLAFVSTGRAGTDVFSMPIDRRGWVVVQNDEAVRGRPAAMTDDAAPVPSVVKAYSPWPTLLPRSWTPLADTEGGHVRLGVGVAGTDVLARHAYSLSAWWRVTGEDGVSVPAARPDWSASYAYDRWRPVFIVAASDRTSFLELTRPDGLAPVPAALREQDAAGGVALPVRRVRHTQRWQAAFNAGYDTLSVGTVSSRRSRPALRSAWAINTGKEYGWSISTEDGLAAAFTSEQVRAAFGADGNADAFTGEVRAYWRPGRGHSVLAARAGYGSSSGDDSVRRRFFLGGSMPAGPLIDFGSDAFRMLRGFDDRVSAGAHIAVTSVEWRQPLVRLERGWGTFPLLLRTIHGAVFLDAGHAWDGGFRLSDVRTSLGAEAALDVVAGFAVRVTLTTGAAWTHDPAAAGRGRGSVYFRLGPSF
jgi:hypothetical protein